QGQSPQHDLGARVDLEERRAVAAVEGDRAAAVDRDAVRDLLAAGHLEGGGAAIERDRAATTAVDRGQHGVEAGLVAVAGSDHAVSRESGSGDETGREQGATADEWFRVRAHAGSPHGSKGTDTASCAATGFPNTTEICDGL